MGSTLFCVCVGPAVAQQTKQKPKNLTSVRNVTSVTLSKEMANSGNVMSKQILEHMPMAMAVYKTTESGSVPNYSSALRKALAMHHPWLRCH